MQSAARRLVVALFLLTLAVGALAIPRKALAGYQCTAIWQPACVEFFGQYGFGMWLAPPTNILHSCGGETRNAWCFGAAPTCGDTLAVQGFPAGQYRVHGVFGLDQPGAHVLKANGMEVLNTPGNGGCWQVRDGDWHPFAAGTQVFSSDVTPSLETESIFIEQYVQEICNGVDDDCDLLIDEDFDCSPGQTEDCITDCGAAGSRQCNSQCGWGPCLPFGEWCNGADDDCDGQTDEGFDCIPGSGGTCQTTCGSTGAKSCQSNCTWGWCQPPTETCNGVDDDCDGTIDNGYACVPGQTQDCMTTCGTGGTRSCQNDCDWSQCQPPPEVCNGFDDDCDGASDEAFSCTLNTAQACTTDCGSPGTQICEPGCQWGDCAPPIEACNGLDDDCDGLTDNGFDCVPGGVGSCTTDCGSEGQKVCDSTCGWGDCMAPAEICNGLDDDCDGQPDDGFPCVPDQTATCTTVCGSQGQRSCGDDCQWDACAPPSEICNNLDDDCDGQRDEDFDCAPGIVKSCTTVCGSQGQQQCGMDCEWQDCLPPTELCNGTDDDCDGQTDEGCLCAGDLIIVSDEETMANGSPAIATYDGNPRWTADIEDATWIWNEYFEDDPGHNSLVVFERRFDLPPDATAVGTLEIGADNSYECTLNGGGDYDSPIEFNYFDKYVKLFVIDDQLLSGSNTLRCEVLNWAQPGGTRYTNPGGLLFRMEISYQMPIGAEVCDGLDNDCDGLTDEDLQGDPTECGQGPCASNGEWVCFDGSWLDTCQPGQPGIEVCNGVDDDCDGIVDEETGTAPPQHACYVYDLCAETLTCDACPPPQAEICNGQDDNCDGTIDEGFACLSGQQQACATACGSTGTQDCTAGCAWGTCFPPAEICNGSDDDCDGQVDEGFECVPGTSMECDPAQIGNSINGGLSIRQAAVVTPGQQWCTDLCVWGPCALTSCGYTQGGWGQHCHGQNVGCLRDQHFGSVFGTAGLSIGAIPYAVQLTSSAAVEAFLPQGGTPAALTQNHVDPTDTEAGVLAGQVASLRLNVAFSDAGWFLTEDGQPLGDVVIVGDEFDGLTVRELAELADQVLAGHADALQPYGLTVADFNEWVSWLNEGGACQAGGPPGNGNPAPVSPVDPQTGCTQSAGGSLSGAWLLLALLGLAVRQLRRARRSAADIR